MLETDLISQFGLLLGASRSSPTKKVGTLWTSTWGASSQGIKLLPASQNHLIVFP